MSIPSRSASPSGTAATTVVLVCTLLSIYIVSQFLRNSVGVIAPNLAAELGLSPAEIGTLSSAFFLAFAAVQLPLGMALDRFGPRRCLVVCAGITVVGAVLFASAPSPGVLILARALLGLGASASLMAPLAIYARRFPADRFATLAGLQVGLGTTGTLIATAPLAFSTATIGWRASFLLVAAVTALIALVLAVVVKDDDTAPAHGRRETFGESLAGVIEVFRIPSIGRLFVMNMVVYSSFAMLVGLWGGPYLTHVYGFSLEQRGSFLLVLVLAQIVGSLLWGPTDRLAGGYKLPVLLGAGTTAAALAYLAAVGTLGRAALVTWLAVFGLLSAYGVVLIAHGKALFPSHLVGRGLALLNMASMGGVFLVQIVSGFVIELFPTAPDGAYALAAYRWVFGLQATIIVLALLAYLSVREPAGSVAKGSSAPIA
jgi:predicted MFS family arabinose efflux permease